MILIVFSGAVPFFLVMVVMLTIPSLSLLILQSEEIPTYSPLKAQLPIWVDAKKALMNMLRSKHTWTYIVFIILIGLMTNKNLLLAELK